MNTGGRVLAGLGFALVVGAGSGQGSIAQEQEPPGASFPFRRVRSVTGYCEVRGNIAVPASAGFYGVGGDHAQPPPPLQGWKECAYNYLGIDTGQSLLEVGMKSDPCDGEYWWGFRNLGGNDFAHLKIPPEPPEGVRVRWPLGGLPPGEPVFIRIYVEAPGRLDAYLSGPGAAYQHEWDCDGATTGGANQRFRRVTSLGLAPNTPGRSFDNNWAGLRLCTDPGDPGTCVDWDVNHTATQEGQSPPAPTGTVTWQPHPSAIHTESVDIQLPQLPPPPPP